MSAKAVSELSAKELLYRHLGHLPFVATPTAVRLTERDEYDTQTRKVEWIAKGEKGVFKPDQLIKRRGKHGLVHLGSHDELKAAFNKRRGETIQIGKTSGRLYSFIVEPFVVHEEKDELYVAIVSGREADVILFYEQGGVDIGDVDAKARRLEIPVLLNEEEQKPSADQLKTLIGDLGSKTDMVTEFISELYRIYKKLHFTYLEINPLVVVNERVYLLNLAAKLDETAHFRCSELWKGRHGEEVEFLAPFGRDLTEEEQYIADLDAKTGPSNSLKLTILNRKGRVWTMVAGGGASVVFTDTVCDLGGATELANYGEYSGDPSETQTYKYAKTLLSIMTEGAPHPKGKVLIIGGSIANFTNVAKTFSGITKAFETFAEKMREHKVTIYVRRGGPNFQEGLRKIKEVGERLSLDLYVFGPETHMTAIVGAALGVRPMPEANVEPHATGRFLLQPERNTGGTVRAEGEPVTPPIEGEGVVGIDGPVFDGGSIGSLFERHTKAIIWGQQQKAIQGMLDFDYVCRRDCPSVVASTCPFTGEKNNIYHFGPDEVRIPTYKTIEKAFKSHSDASILVTFAPRESVYETVTEALEYSQIKVIAIIAEGVPENQTRRLIKLAAEKGVVLIGPATVGGLKPGCFKIGNTGGLVDTILASKLHRPGSVAYVSRSGGMSNELNNIISQNTDGVFEGIVIGGDRYPGSTYTDHVLRYQRDPRVKMIVLLGEVGGVEEHSIVNALKDKQITKPLVAWCIGTCADHITSEVQFGHAGASAHGQGETAAIKNAALAEAGAHVPASFDDLGKMISSVYRDLVESGVIVPKSEVPLIILPIVDSHGRSRNVLRAPINFSSLLRSRTANTIEKHNSFISSLLKNYPHIFASPTSQSSIVDDVTTESKRRILLTLMNGSSAVVTGGGSGIGRAICSRLAENGVRIFVVDADKAAADQTMDSLHNSSSHVAIDCDVSKSDSVATLKSEVLKSNQVPPSILINCAGITKDSTLLKAREERCLHDIIDMEGTKKVSQAFIRASVEAQSPLAIVNISSIIGKVGNFGQTNYAATKAVIGWTKSAAKELAGKVGLSRKEDSDDLNEWTSYMSEALADKNVRVNNVLTGFVKTPMTDAMPPDVLKKICDGIPMNRMGEVGEIADAVLFLSSPLASYITGTTIEMTGGLHM